MADDVAPEHSSHQARQHRDGSAERRDFAECEKGEDHEAVFEDRFHFSSGGDWHGIRSLFDCVSIDEESLFTDFSGSIAALASNLASPVATRTALLPATASSVTFRAVLPSSGVSPEVCEAVRAGSRFHFRSSICVRDHRLPMKSHTLGNFPALALLFSSCSNSLEKMNSDDDLTLDVLHDAALWLARLRVDFGSLWWVDEALWEKHLKHYPGAEDRDGHPGASLMFGRLYSTFDRVPLLFGRSARPGEKGPVLARLDPCHPAHLTVFGTKTHSARIRVDEFDDRVATARVQPWQHKQELDPAEKAILRAWYERNLQAT